MEEFELCGMQSIDEKVITSRTGYESGSWRKRRNPWSCETAISETRVLRLGVGFVHERLSETIRILIGEQAESIVKEPMPQKVKEIRSSLSIARSQKPSPL